MFLEPYKENSNYLFVTLLIYCKVVWESVQKIALSILQVSPSINVLYTRTARVAACNSRRGMEIGLTGEFLDLPPCHSLGRT